MSDQRRSFFGQEVAEDGYVRRYFQDHFGGEDWDLQIFICMDAEMAYFNGLYERDMELEDLRRRTDNFDPNICDSRNVRKEFDKNWINLGMKAGRIPANVRRI